MDKLTELNLQNDSQYYKLEKSKQELIKMRDNDYEGMMKKNTKIINEFNALQKYYQLKVSECEELEKSNM